MPALILHASLVDVVFDAHLAPAVILIDRTHALLHLCKAMPLQKLLIAIVHRSDPWISSLILIFVVAFVVVVVPILWNLLQIVFLLLGFFVVICLLLNPIHNRFFAFTFKI